MKKDKRRNAFPRMIKTVLTAVLLFSVFIGSTQKAFAATKSQVITGKNGWLFYSGEDTISDYQGSDLLTIQQLERLRAHLENFRDELALQGCEFVVFIAPNKEQIYAEYMPDSYGSAAPYTRAQQVCDYLTYAGIRVVYPVAEMKAAVADHPEYNYYYFGDTHWNSLGAYIGARALLNELGIEWPEPEQLGIESYIINQGDLAGLIGRYPIDIDYSLAGYPGQPLLTADLSQKSVAYFTTAGADERKLMIVGDSFANALSGYMASAFDQVVVSHDRQNYRPTLLTKEQPDVYVYEVVERYVGVMNNDYGLFTEADLYLNH